MQELTGAWLLIYRRVTVSTYLLELTFEDCLKIHQINSTGDLTWHIAGARQALFLLSTWLTFQQNGEPREASWYDNVGQNAVEAVKGYTKVRCYQHPPWPPSRAPPLPVGFLNLQPLPPSFPFWLKAASYPLSLLASPIPCNFPAAPGPHSAPSNRSSSYKHLLHPLGLPAPVSCPLGCWQEAFPSSLHPVPFGNTLYTWGLFLLAAGVQPSNRLIGLGQRRQEGRWGNETQMKKAPQPATLKKQGGCAQMPLNLEKCKKANHRSVSEDSDSPNPRVVLRQSPSSPSQVHAGCMKGLKERVRGDTKVKGRLLWRLVSHYFCICICHLQSINIRWSQRLN